MSDSSFYDPQWTVLQKLKYIETWTQANNIRTDSIKFEIIEMTSDSVTVEVHGTNFRGNDVTLPAFTIPTVPGKDGVTPDITISAYADDTSLADPYVHVSKSGTDESPVYKFGFYGIKGISIVDIYSVAIKSGVYELFCTLSDGTTISAGVFAFGQGTEDEGGNEGEVDPDDPTKVQINGLEYQLNDDGTASIIAFNPDEFNGILYISNITVDGRVYPVLDIPADLFTGNTDIKHLTIGASISEIPESAFAECTGLTRVVFENSVTSIGARAFYNCTSLESLVIPDSVTYIGDYAFYYCSSLESLVIPDSVTSIGDYAFYHCNSLESLVIPDSVTSIGDYAFYNCSSLESLVIPDSVTSIGDYAFYNCTLLESLVIPDSVTSIGTYNFNYMDSIKTISLGTSIAFLGNYAFSNYGSNSSSSNSSSSSSSIQYIKVYSKYIDNLSSNISGRLASVQDDGYDLYFLAPCTHIPSYFIQCKTTSNAGGYKSCTIHNIYIAKTVTNISANALYPGSASNAPLTITGKIYYEGTADDIDIASSNDVLNAAEWVYNWDGVPVDD